MKKTYRLVVLLIFIAVAIAPGCYTVLKHPVDENDYQATQVSDCTRCHGDYQEYPYGYYYAPYPDYWWENDNFGYYYAYPWWWDHYDYPYIEGGYAENSRSSKFSSRQPHQLPLPPPHSITPDIPFPMGMPGGGHIIIDGGGTRTTTRPQTETDAARSRDGSTGANEAKETRQSNQVQQTAPATDTKSKSVKPEKKKVDSSKKKKSTKKGKP